MTIKDLLEEYKKIIPYSSLEKLTGINQRQLQRYGSGKTIPREEQCKRIKEALNLLGKQLIDITNE